MRPLCAFDLDHTLVRSPLDLVRLKGEIRALVEAEGLPLPEATRAWTIGQIIEAATVHRTALGERAGGSARRTRRRPSITPSPSRARTRPSPSSGGGLSPRALDQQHGVGRAPGPRELRARRILHGPGTRDEAALKPDPSGLRLLEAAFPERRIWVVGDSWVDGAAAHAGGAAFIAYGADPSSWPAGAWRRAPSCAICARSRSGFAPPPGSAPSRAAARPADPLSPPASVAS